ncbi:hypothetical protein GCM10025859_17900 [Alicyclobacillus fastidiosus]|nr:hypothetical protein GCM10025859_17900 [Alicyclobacillus fastidiosus]
MGNTQRKVEALNLAWQTIYGDVLDIHSRKLTEGQEIYKDSVKAILGMVFIQMYTHECGVSTPSRILDLWSVFGRGERSLLEHKGT